MWREPSFQPSKLKSQWGYGVWLGRAQKSDAHIIGTRLGIVLARAVGRLPSSEQEDAQLVMAMRGTPAQMRPRDANADPGSVTAHTAAASAAAAREHLAAAPGAAPEQEATGSSAVPASAGAAEGPRQDDNPIPADAGNGPPRMPQPPQAPAENAPFRGPPGLDLPLSAAPGAPCDVAMHGSVILARRSAPPVEDDEEGDATPPKRPRGRPPAHRCPVPGTLKYTEGCPGCDGRAYSAGCVRMRRELGLLPGEGLAAASSGPAWSGASSAPGGGGAPPPAPSAPAVLSAPPDLSAAGQPPPPQGAASPPTMDAPAGEPSAVSLAAACPFGHEEPPQFDRETYLLGLEGEDYFEVYSGLPCLSQCPRSAPASSAIST